MEIKKILEDLNLLSDIKIRIEDQSQDEATQWEVEEFIKDVKIPSDYADFLRQYGYGDVEIQNKSIELFIAGLGHLSESFDVKDFSTKDAQIKDTEIESVSNEGFMEPYPFPIHFSICMYDSDKLRVRVYFYLSLLEPTGIFYNLSITDLLSGRGINDGKSDTVRFSSEDIYYVSDFATFVSKIPELISQKGLRGLIDKAGIDFDIDKVGSYGHLRVVIPPRVYDGLPDDDLPF